MMYTYNTRYLLQKKLYWNLTTLAYLFIYAESWDSILWHTRTSMTDQLANLRSLIVPLLDLGWKIYFNHCRFSTVMLRNFQDISSSDIIQIVLLSDLAKQCALQISFHSPVRLFLALSHVLVTMLLLVYNYICSVRQNANDNNLLFSCMPPASGPGCISKWSCVVLCSVPINK